MSLIKPYTPLYRGTAAFNCGAPCEPIRINADGSFYFWLPTATGDSRYVLRFDLDGSTVDVIPDIVEVLEDGEIVKVTLTDGLLGIFIEDTGSVTQVTGKCIPMRLALRFGARPYSYVDQGSAGTWNFVSFDCGQYIEVLYKIDCEQVQSYTYVLKGGLVRLPSLVSDELNAITPAGLPRRVFTRTLDLLRLGSYPFGQQEHDFIRTILNFNQFSVSGMLVGLNEGAIWNPQTVDTLLSSGTVELVYKGQVVKECCEVVEPPCQILLKIPEVITVDEIGNGTTFIFGLTLVADIVTAPFEWIKTTDLAVTTRQDIIDYLTLTYPMTNDNYTWEVIEDTICLNWTSTTAVLQCIYARSYFSDGTDDVATTTIVENMCAMNELSGNITIQTDPLSPCVAASLEPPTCTTDTWIQIATPN